MYPWKDRTSDVARFAFAWPLLRHRRLTKRIVKAPKVHLTDTGLACYLLGIREPDQLRLHPLRGPLFESWVASEILKARLHRGLEPDMFHLREDRGAEVDLLVEAGRTVFGVEVKSGATLVSEFFDDLRDVAQRFAQAVPHLHFEPRLVYGGGRSEKRDGLRAIAWDAVPDQTWW